MPLMSTHPLKMLAVTLGIAVLAAGGGYAFQNQKAAGKAAAPSMVMEVYKTPTCGCCSLWVDHVRAAGFKVTSKDVTQAELTALKAKHGVPAEMHSCHTGLTDGYVIEGHIPAREVIRFLQQRPAAAGLAVPGMPLGSPGMEAPGVTARPYSVMSFDKQGRTTLFATIRP